MVLSKWANSDVIKGTDLNMIGPPVGSIVAWAKTFAAADSGTTTSDVVNKLVQTGQNFNTTISVDMIVHNTTDNTFAYVTAIDSDTTLSLSADIMDNAEAYTIYKTPRLPDGWVECAGQVLSDTDSPYDGATIPDLNVTQRFLRGKTASGATGGANTIDLNHNHAWFSAGGSSNHYQIEAGYDMLTYDSGGTLNTSPANTTTNYTDKQLSATQSILPAYYEVVWIMKVKHKTA